jgi:transcriptional regulator with XRE-family HTH domain
MQPEQVRAARAALNWSLERLAEASGVHRNTISNFETRKFIGEPETLAAVKRALKDAGIILIDENGRPASVGLRRFQVGDIVRFRPQTRVRFDYHIEADEVGEVVGVEPHPPQTGPTYKIQVQFERALVPFVWRSDYELVRASPDPVASSFVERKNGKPMTDPKEIIGKFCILCERTWMDWRLYGSLVETGQRGHDLCMSIAPLFFDELNRILAEYSVIQICKITDPARTGKKMNLTTNYIVEELPWPDPLRRQLEAINARLKAFREHVEPGRSKRIVHVDFSAQTSQTGAIGAFPDGADRKFFKDLQEFVNIAFGHHHDGHQHPIEVAMSTDTDQLIRAFVKSKVFDQCTRCDAGQRAIAVLDYEHRT